MERFDAIVVLIFPSEIDAVTRVNEAVTRSDLEALLDALKNPSLGVANASAHNAAHFLQLFRVTSPISFGFRDNLEPDCHDSSHHTSLSGGLDFLERVVLLSRLKGRGLSSFVRHPLFPVNVYSLLVEIFLFAFPQQKD